MNAALPSRMIPPGSRREFELMHAGAALLAQEVRRVANVCAYWRANVMKKGKSA